MGCRNRPINTSSRIAKQAQTPSDLSQCIPDRNLKEVRQRIGIGTQAIKVTMISHIDAPSIFQY